MRKLKENPVLLILSIISLTLGLSLIFTDHTKIINFIYFIIGGSLIITGISKMLLENHRSDKSYQYDGIINIVVGILIMFVHNIVVTVILGLGFIVFPLIRILKSSNKKLQFKSELPLLIIGLVIALSGDLIANIFIKFLGAILILLAIYLFINIFTNKIQIFHFSSKKKPKIKQTDDNVIDVEYVESDSDE